MSSRHHIDNFMRGRIIGKIDEGQKIIDVAREFDIAHSVVSRLWKSFKTTVILNCLQKTDISTYQQKEKAHHNSVGGKSLSCCLRKADLQKNCYQTFEGRRTTRTQTYCVCPIDQTAPYCKFAMVS
ncbi:hypothetical protein TNCV_3559481 [Trichonephila clavipes]|uniref:Uncharacterized protein n=1 Tax=Trichonephila clavipes TaxID=2585209 RepID=A0A8X6WCV8_TRICX|nr:hypothetical protein TNCV_3559481 [Trichonephila clavipes]